VAAKVQKMSEWLLKGYAKLCVTDSGDKKMKSIMTARSMTTHKKVDYTTPSAFQQA